MMRHHWPAWISDGTICPATTSGPDGWLPAVTMKSKANAIQQIASIVSVTGPVRQLIRLKSRLRGNGRTYARGEKRQHDLVVPGEHIAASAVEVRPDDDVGARSVVTDEIEIG